MTPEVQHADVAPEVRKRRRYGGLVFWASSAHAPAERRPTDVVMLALSVVTLGALLAAAPGPTRVDDAVAGLLASVPGLLGWFWESAYALALVWALTLVVVAACSRGRRRLLVDQLVAAVLTLAVAGLIAVAEGASWGDIGKALTTQSTHDVFPAIRLAVVIAVVAVSAPYISRPVRGTGWVLVLVGSVAGMALGIDTPLAVAVGLVVGVGASALVHLAFGSPGGRAPLELVAAELADLGVLVTSLRHAPADPRGVATVRGSDRDGRPILVRIYGRDAAESSLFSSLWTRLWYRDAVPSSSVGRRTQVEHEAYLTLLAERAGVPVQPVLRAGSAWGRDALLVRRDDGRALVDLTPDEVTPDVLAGLWTAMDKLHSAAISHGRVRPRALVLRDDGCALADLASGSASPDPSDIVADNAQLLVCTAAATDVATSVAAAQAALSADALVALVAYLQPAALDAETRAAAKAAPWTIDELRAAVVAATGVPAPPLEKLRRVSLASVAMLVVLALVAYAVISAIAGIGLDTLVSEFQGAEWGWVLAAVLIAPLIQVGQAVATLGATMTRLKFVPVLGLQYAIAFLGLAVPSSAAKIALTIRFFQLVGSNPTAAVAISLINTVAGLLVQLLVIGVTLLTGLVTLSPPASSGTSEKSSLAQTLADVNWTAVLVIALVLVVLVVLLVVAVPRLRRFVRGRATESVQALRVLRSPRKLGLILAGSVAWNVVAALVLGASVRAFGQSASFAELILINTLVALFAGLMPIPGNIGVSEAALTAGLAAIGIDQAAALSAAIVYRAATFYIPPVYGAVALKRMRVAGYL